MISIAGLTTIILTSCVLYVMGYFLWVYPLRTTVYGFKLYALMNFPNPYKAIRYVEDELGVPLRDDPEEGYRQYFELHPEFVARYKLAAIGGWCVATIFICVILYAMIQGEMRVI